MKISEMRADRAKKYEAFKAFGEKADFDPAIDQAEYETLKKAVEAVDAQIKRAHDAEDLAAKGAQPVEGQSATVAAAPKEKTYPVGSFVKALHHAQGNVMLAAQWGPRPSIPRRQLPAAPWCLRILPIRSSSFCARLRSSVHPSR